MASSSPSVFKQQYEGLSVPIPKSVQIRHVVSRKWAFEHNFAAKLEDLVVFCTYLIRPGLIPKWVQALQSNPFAL